MSSKFNRIKRLISDFFVPFVRMKRILVLGIGLFFSAAVSAQEVTLPNVFTPDGDGINDVFRITTSGYDAMTCTIFNRHGEPVYRFYGLNGTWDAFTHAGVKVTAGVYFVLLELTLPDGSSETRQSTLEVLY